LVERLIRNQQVAGSIPAGGSKPQQSKGFNPHGRSVFKTEKEGFDQMILNIKNGEDPASAAPKTALVVAWERFIREKQYIKNLSPATIYDYGCAWKAWARWMPDDPKEITGEHVHDATMGMRVQRLSAISTNSYLRVLRAFVRWLRIPGDGRDGLLQVPMIHAPRLVPRTFTRDELLCLIHFQPTTMTTERIALLVKMYLDTGARAEELLALRRGDLNIDDLLIKISGKGARERMIPFSLPLRADLHRWMAHTPDAPASEYLFPTPRGHYSYRNALRDFVAMAKSKGITGRRVSLHTLRHSFATLYIANGGDPMRLQRLLGHSTLAMTEKYVSLQTQDLSQVHGRFSPLGSILQGRRGR
jgi:integrase/recombinase XerD